MGVLASAGRWYDGRVYATVVDRLLAGVHGYVASHLPDGDRVLDAACGTGTLAQEIARTGRTVVGVDLSPRQVEFARQRAEQAGFGRELRFEVGDLRGLAVPDAGPYDLATIVLALHEMSRDVRGPVLGGLVRAAETVMIVDFAAPLAWNAPGMVKRAAELAAGREHHGAFRDYLAAGGLDAVVGDAGVATITDRTIDSGTLRVMTVRGGAD